MAYTQRIVKTLRFPGDESHEYQVNAVKLSGHTWDEIDQRFSTIESFDALRYMGSLNKDDTLPAANKGDVYKVAFNGTLAGATVEIGDMLICNQDNTVAGNTDNWDIIQSNIDVAAILDHTHTGSVDFTRSNKTLTHKVTPTRGISANFTDGSASVNGAHSHTASGTVSVSEGGVVGTETITPKGIVKLAETGTVGENDIVITPEGTIDTATTVTNVELGDITISTHNVTDVSSEGAHTHQATLKMNSYTPEGSVAEHEHDVAVSVTPSGDKTVLTDTEVGGNYLDPKTGLAPTEEIDDGILVIGAVNSDTTINYVTNVTVSEVPKAPTFTGTSMTLEGSVEIDNAGDHTHEITVADHDTITPDLTVDKTAHDHTFTGESINVTATFTGTAESHSHGFTPNASEVKNVSVTVNEFTGSFTGDSSGTVVIENGDKVVTDVAIEEHTISTVDTGSFTTSEGKQE